MITKYDILPSPRKSKPLQSDVIKGILFRARKEIKDKIIPSMSFKSHLLKILNSRKIIA